jgi:putative hydrolases of HD superfamily
VEPPASAGPLGPAGGPVDERLRRQLSFLLEADRLKTVLRQSALTDGSRRENSAEHSWHVALFAMLLAEHAREPVDASRVVRMLVVHDLVEVDAGDTYVYDDQAQATRMQRERVAAHRLFGLLPADQGSELRALWEEFEAHETAESRFAAAVDRLSPVLAAWATRGTSWRLHGVGADQVREVNRLVGEAAPDLGAVVEGIVEEAVAGGWIEG